MAVRLELTTDTLAPGTGLLVFASVTLPVIEPIWADTGRNQQRHQCQGPER